MILILSLEPTSVGPVITAVGITLGGALTVTVSTPEGRLNPLPALMTSALKMS